VPLLSGHYFARWRLATIVAGAVLLSVAGGVHSGGILPVAGLALIVASLVPAPWGTERYRRTCARAIVRAAREVGLAEDRSYTADAEQLASFRRVVVPTRFRAEHDELLRLLETDGRLRRDRSAVMKERALARLDVRDQIRAVTTRLETLAPAEDERYSAELVATVRARRRHAEDRARECGQAISQLIERQGEIRPPDALGAVHDSMCRAFGEELTAMWAYQTALLDGDAEALRAAAQSYEEAIEACAAQVEALGIRTRPR
jgi:hypothetical protein